MNDETTTDTVLTEQEPPAHDTPSDVFTSWPDLCLWLAEQELFVFVNAIDPQQHWCWCWMGKISVGYPDAQAAILAALQERVYPTEMPPADIFSAGDCASEMPTQQKKRKRLF